MIRLRDPYIKPPQIVDRLPKPSTGYVVPDTYANITGVTIYPMPNLIITPSWFSTPVNRFISASGYWHCASNWSLGHVPTFNEDVLISGVGQVYCLVHGDAQMHDLTVANRVYLEIGAHAHISVHTLTLEPNAWLNLQDSQWAVSGDWNSGPAHIDGGTSTVNFGSGLNVNPIPYNITTTGAQFYGGANGQNTS
jgi:hypothetical protein